MVQTRVQRWGNSLAVRIPKPLAEDLYLEESSPVDLSLVEGKLVLSPTRPPFYDLAGLMEGVKEENLHREVDTGTAIGDEIW